MDSRNVKILMPLIWFLYMRTATSSPYDKDESEPHCYSRFDYEYKVVQKLVLLENTCSKLESENENLQQQVENLNNKLKEQEQSVPRRGLHPSSFVAFLAVLNQQRLLNIPAQDTIIFETVITNIGNAYSSTDGCFTATQDGVYQFSATVMADNNGEVWCYIKLNGDTMARIYGRASDGRHDQGSQTIILQLRKGDRVCVINNRKTNIYGERYTSFSGVLLKPIVDG